ncbi:hypothetical protein Smp_139770 [Schistosoma mansoni]|uniref:hypothetical protein n=1 Tax=Schistosoma mansoni TaxID=6183 RepID=UPI00022DCB86|nr:hypothetical protein Smp_139770 [Schistosoma mansoni]|eukprot:XP_018655451.1 hypothetical protein Smp_139770 [Schistosoma mansoni]
MRNPRPMNSSRIDNLNLCRTLSTYRNSRDGYKVMFQDITEYRQLEKITLNFNEIPLKLVHVNKNLLLDFAKTDDITDMELYIHGSFFYHSVEEMFRMLPAEISYDVIDHHLQNLMISILTYETRNMKFGYSASELQQCFKINDFAAQSVNIFGDLTVNWFKALSTGLTRYLNTRKILQFDDLNYFLSATTVYNLIKKGIKETDENEALIQAKLEKFCRRNKPRTLQTTTSLFSNLNGNDHTLNETLSNYLQLNTEEYDKLNNFIKKVARDLNSYLQDRDDKVQYMRNIELLYCSQEDKNQCWNGSSFDRYYTMVN